MILNTCASKGGMRQTALPSTLGIAAGGKLKGVANKIQTATN